jgi:hypothetical protein
MTLRPWADVAYLPILGMRPAEMRALEELPGQTKDALLPLIPLRPWVGSHHLTSTVERIEKSYGERPVVVSVGEREPVKDRPVFAELERLREPDDGFANWCEFIEAHANYVPVAQLGLDEQQEPAQIEKLYALQRGLVLHLERRTHGFLGAISNRVGELTGGGDGVCFIVDFETATQDHLQVAALALGYIQALRAHSPHAYISISASSFPNGFTDLIEQQIYERRLFNELVGQPGVERLIYSDRGSARAEQLSGGSGVIPSRIDYPLFNDWKFYRSAETGFSGYMEQAKALTKDNAVWNSNLRVWGTQMIERTARGDFSAIDTPQKATAARINLHLQLQTFYGQQDQAEDTEEDWDG